jgi:hypothetical protein
MANFERLNILFKPRPGFEGPEVKTQYLKTPHAEKNTFERFQATVIGVLRDALVPAAKIHTSLADQIHINLALGPATGRHVQ